MKQVIVLLTTIAFFLLACKEDEKAVTTIQGTVVNIGSKEPVDSVMVVAVDGANNEKAQVIKYTDTRGKFNVSIEGNNPCIYLVKEGYRFVVFSEGHGSSENFKAFAAGETFNNEVLELWADAYFKPIFVKKDCNPSDSTYIDEGNNIPLGFQKTTFLIQGCEPIDRWSINGTKGIGDTYFHYWIKYQIQGVWNERIDSVYIPSFTTYTDTIYY